MINAVGLSGPGVPRWIETGYRELEESGATIVASIWGRTADEFAAAAHALQGLPLAASDLVTTAPNCLKSP